MQADADAASEKVLSAPRTKTNKTQERWHWFTTPQPIKQLFDKFPLVAYPPNELPQRTARNRGEHALYIFTTGEGASSGAASFNPGCLKWQVRSFSALIPPVDRRILNQPYGNGRHI